METRIRSRLCALALSAAILAPMLPAPFAQALEVTDVGSFDPIAQEVEIEFNLQFTQPVDIKVYVDDKLRGYIFKDKLLEGYDGELEPRDPCDDPAGMSVSKEIVEEAPDETEPPAEEPAPGETAPPAEDDAAEQPSDPQQPGDEGGAARPPDAADTAAGEQPSAPVTPVSKALRVLSPARASLPENATENAPSDSAAESDGDAENNSIPPEDNTEPAPEQETKPVENPAAPEEIKPEITVSGDDNSMLSDLKVSIVDKQPTDAPDALDADIDDATPGHFKMTWDGRIEVDGETYALIGEDPLKDLTDVEVVIQPLGYPEKNRPCETDEDGNITSHGENWTWTTQFTAGFSITLDYQLYDLLMRLDSALPGHIEDFREIYAALGAEGLKDLEAMGLTEENLAIKLAEALDPVSLLSGAYVSEYTDLRLEGGIPLTFSRMYNSVYAGGSLGKGFTHSYEYTLTEDKGIIIVTAPYGEELHFIRRQPGFGAGYHALQNSDFTLADDGSGYALTHADGAVLHFDDAGHLVSITNALGVDSVTLTYNGDELSRIEGIAGSFDLTWADGVITEVTDSAGRTVTYAHDGSLLIGVTNPDGDALSFSYDENGYVSECTDFEGETYLYNTYDDQGRVTYQKFITADVPTEATFTYDDSDENDRVHAYTNAQGFTTAYHYDEHWQLTKTVTDEGETRTSQGGNFRSDGATNNQGDSVSLTRDAAGNVTSASYPDGSKYAYTYNAQNQVTQITDPLGHTQSYAYDGNRNITRYTDANSNATSYTYNALSLPETVTDALGNTITYNYDSNGRLLSVTDAEGGVISYAYDAVGRIETQTDPLGHETKYTYSTAGKLTQVTDALGGVTKYEYNANGFTTKTTDALGNVTTTEYGTNGQALSETDANGNQTEYAYDENGLLSSVTDAEGHATSYEYDEQGRTAAAINAAGGRTAYEYDSLGRQIKTIDADGNETETEYDKMGRVLRAIDAEGNATAYQYDELGRTVKITDAEGNETTTAYDAVGNVLSTTDAKGVTTSSVYDVANRLIKSADGMGFETTYEYDKVGRQTKITGPLGGVTSYTYDAAGNQLSMTDPNGHVTSCEYDALNRAVKQINPDGGVTTTAYDALGRTLSQTDALGAVTRYEYDAAGNQIRVTDPLGRETAYTYDGSNRTASVTYADGGVVSYTYSPLGAIARTTDQNGNITRAEYDKLGRKSSETDAVGTVTAYTYDGVGNVLETRRNGVLITQNEYSPSYRLLSVTDGLGGKTSYAYDAAGNRTAVTDKRGSVTRYEYDANYRTVKITDALGGVTATEYDKLGRTVKSTDAEGRSVSNTYDPAGNLLTYTDALGYVTKYVYDDMNRRTRTEDARGAVTVTTYDHAGQTLTQTDARGGVSRNTYDANRNLVTTVNHKNEKTVYTYDKMNRVLTETNGLNHTQSYAYDLAGNVLRETDRNKHVTTYAYDALGRMTEKTDAEGGLLRYAYDAFGNTASVTTYGAGDALSTTAYAYDVIGNQLSETSPLGYQTTYEYDAEGNLLSKTDRDGKRTAYEYDALGRQVKRTDADGEAGFTYDKVGSQTAVVDPAGTLNFTFDAGNRIIMVEDAAGGETAYTYDETGSRLSVTYPDGKAVSYAYDANGNQTELLDHDGRSVSYTYDADDRPIKENHADGSTTEYDYNSAGLMTQLKEVDKAGATRREILYGYDDAGNLVSEMRRGVDIGKIQQAVFYTYDKANRLVKTVTDGRAETCAYDKAGNLLSDGESTYTYDLQNRLTAKNGTAYTYDQSGNLLSDGENTYEYNAQNKLVKGTNAKGETSEYTYNALGVRTRNVQHRGNWNAGHANQTLDNGSRFIKDYTEALKDGRAYKQPAWMTEVGTTVQNDPEGVVYNYTTDYLSLANRDILVEAEGEYVTRYVYGTDSERVSAEYSFAESTNPGEAGENIVTDMAANDVSKVYFRHSLLDSTLFAVDEDGAVIAHMTYDAWGEPQTETKLDANYAGIDNLNNFTGYTYDETLNLYFAQNRFYNPETHRFTQEDPIKDGGNWYGYCGNNPIIQNDMFGLNYSLVMYNSSYQLLSTGVLSDRRYASIGRFALREVMKIVNQAQGYSMAISQNRTTEKVTLLITANGTAKQYSYQPTYSTQKIYSGNLYFTYYHCSRDEDGDVTYIDLESLAKSLGCKFSTEDLFNPAIIPIEKANTVTALGVSAYGELLLSLSISTALVWDSNGKIGIMDSFEIGAGMLGAGLSLIYGTMQADGIESLSGKSLTIGWSILSAGGDYSIGLNGEGVTGTLSGLSKGALPKNISLGVGAHARFNITNVTSSGKGVLLRLILGYGIADVVNYLFNIE